MAVHRHSEHTVFNSEFTQVQKAKLNLHKFYTFIPPHERTSTERLPAGSDFYARIAQGRILFLILCDVLFQTTHLKSHRTTSTMQTSFKRPIGSDSNVYPCSKRVRRGFINGWDLKLCDRRKQQLCTNSHLPPQNTRGFCNSENNNLPHGKKQGIQFGFRP